MRFNNLIIYLFIYLFAMQSGFAMSVFGERENREAKIFSRVALEKKGKMLAEQGKYQDALEVFDEALNPALVSYRSQHGMAVAGKRNVYKLLGEYQKALEVQSWYLVDNKKPEFAIFEMDEIKALMEYKKTGDASLVYAHIGRIKDDEVGSKVPPAGYGLAASAYISDILRLYDTIGDHDAGIAYLDEVVSFLRERRKDKGDSSYVLYDIPTSEEAIACINKPAPNPDKRGCEVTLEFLLIREAFEQDKKEGTKGRATIALIKSDHFPW